MSEDSMLLPRRRSRNASQMTLTRIVRNARKTIASFAPRVMPSFSHYCGYAGPQTGRTPSSFLFFLPRRIAIEDLASPPLQPCVADEVVFVDRRLVHHALGLEQVCPRAN